MPIASPFVSDNEDWFARLRRTDPRFDTIRRWDHDDLRMIPAPHPQIPFSGATDPGGEDMLSRVIHPDTIIRSLGEQQHGLAPDSPGPLDRRGLPQDWSRTTPGFLRYRDWLDGQKM